MVLVWFRFFDQPRNSSQAMQTKKQPRVKSKVSFSLFTARRLETHKELDLDNEDFAKLQHFTLPPINIETPGTFKQRTMRPLRRCQSARAHFQGHTRNRSLGRRDSNQSQVAFSSPIVSTKRSS